MSSLKKTFVLLSAAIAMSSLDGEADAAKAQPAPSEKDKVKKAEGQKKRVAKHRKARRRPADWDMDFGMPAGTAYDVISRDEI
jgi:hypothetical protein